MKILTKVISLVLVNFLLTQAMVLAFDKLQKPEIQAPVITKAPKPKLNTSIPTITQPLPTTNPTVIKVPSEQKTEVIQPEPNSSCIIIVDSQRYDVTEFRKIHGGGDTFKCGSDMTQDFYSQHTNSYLIKMERYKI